MIDVMENIQNNYTGAEINRAKSSSIGLIIRQKEPKVLEIRSNNAQQHTGRTQRSLASYENF
jgi:hypothetical protein